MDLKLVHDSEPSQFSAKKALRMTQKFKKLRDKSGLHDSIVLVIIGSQI
jgi:hypothetical protein